MQKILAALVLSAIASLTAAAQSHPGPSPRADVAVTYNWVHTNAQPGDCGCFGLNGGGISASWYPRQRVGIVADVSSETSSSAGQAGSSLTLTSYLGGLRYYAPTSRSQVLLRFEPFGEVLVGGAHAGGSGAGAADGSNAFAARVGGGLDVPVSKVFVVRLAQIDYLPSTFDNTTNQHQNNLLVSGGIVVRWSRSR